MTAKERGFLLLTSQLGDPARRPLTTAQFRVLSRRVREMARPTADRDLTQQDLRALGYGPEQAQRILVLLHDQTLLDHYLLRAAQAGCTPLSRLSDHYPMSIHNRLGDDAPGCIWAKGDLASLSKPAISLVGSRDLTEENLAFAQEVGRQAALQDLVLVSGNARGADKAAQRSCLEHGGQVIAVVADELERHQAQENVLYLSEESFDLPFSAQRALSRNRAIHCMGLRTFVAQATYQKGGSWDGAVRNLRHRWSPLYCHDDGSQATKALIDMGATGIFISELHDIPALPIRYFSLFDQ
ncbi:MAG: DNA-processing protein DprA [Oscillospiraceae bacterium]|nr:DNA-processing protein DprA [Oscillospiraceae bacterium]